MAYTLSSPGSVSSSSIWTLTFPISLSSTYVGNSLPSGAYSLAVSIGTISQTFTFTKFFADVDGNGNVNGTDASIWSTSYGKGLGNVYYHSYDDFNSDGVVNGSDYAQYAANFGHSLSPSGSFSGPMFSGRSLTQNGTGRILANLAPRDLYYSSQWQVLEERAMNADTGTLQVNDQNVWGQAYVDEMVLRDSRSLGNTTGSGNLGLTGSGLDSRIYVEQDANWNTTSLLDNAGNALEDIVYDPYGNVSVLNAGLASIAPEGFNWQYFHQGGRLDLTTGNYLFRHRDYSPTLARWTEADWIKGYKDGMDLYLDERDNPVDLLDPQGSAPLPAGRMPKRPGPAQPPGGLRCRTDLTDCNTKCGAQYLICNALLDEET